VAKFPDANIHSKYLFIYLNMLSSLFFYDMNKIEFILSASVGQLFVSFLCTLSWSYAVAQLMEALRYKPENRRIDSR
jgi:hypothetical protein